MNEDKLDQLIDAANKANARLDVIVATLIDAHGPAGLNRALTAAEDEITDLEVKRLAAEIDLEETADRFRHDHEKDS